MVEMDYEDAYEESLLCSHPTEGDSSIKEEIKDRLMKIRELCREMADRIEETYSEEITKITIYWSVEYEDE